MVYVINLDEIARGFGCRVLASKPMRAVNMVQTDQGLAIIKEVFREPDKILYIHNLKEYLFESGFTCLDRYMLSVYQLPFLFVDNRVFVMERFIKGRECSFTNPFDREKIVKALARLHLAGKGYVPPTGSASRNNIGKWKKSDSSKLNDLLAFKRLAKAKKKKSRFDRLFLEDVDHYIEMGWRGFDTLNHSQYDVVCDKAARDNTVCHHDYTYHNLIIDEFGNVNVIDFDYSCHELPVYDLAALILKILRRYSYDIDMAVQLMQYYHEVSPLNRDDCILMLSLFEFPQKFWRIAERYYNGKTDWKEELFISKYNDIICDKAFQADFIEEFRSRIL